ncbi:MAG: ATP synthase subunit I [Gammaproteobacteria bacterium]|nr:ATP synthase subunit I [Gammaproteobacteria bacterium]
MTPADKDVSGGGLGGAARAVLLYQAAITVLTAAAFMYLGGLRPAVAALYGGLVAMVLSWMLKRRVTRVTEVSAGKGMLLLYLGVVQRFLLVLALFALALGVLKLDPLASIVGFGLGQLGYVISRVSYKG